MPRFFLPALAAIALAAPTHAQTDARSYAAMFDSRDLASPETGAVTYHIDTRSATSPGALIVFLGGSGSLPLFQTYADGSHGFSLPGELLRHLDDYHLLLIDKPGVPLIDQAGFDEQAGRPTYDPGPRYAATLSRQWRENAALLAISDAVDRLGGRITHVVVIGHSEGAQIVYDVARRSPHVAAAVGMGGPALPQYYDFVIDARQAADRGEITQDEAQARIDALFAQIREIQADPANTEREWNGHSFLRWSSFGFDAVLDDMLALEIPLLMVYGAADRNGPIINADYAALAFLEAGKTNLDYWVYPNSDHFFREPDPARPGQAISRMDEVIRRVLGWVEGHAPD